MKGKVEAYFLGVLAFGVFAVVVFATVTTRLTGKAGTSGSTTVQGVSGNTAAASQGGSSDIICECYNAGFKLAAKTGNVQSTAYRTGFSQCRALASVEGGDAWTAGWEAKLSGRAYEVTCKAYKRRSR